MHDFYDDMYEDGYSDPQDYMDKFEKDAYESGGPQYGDSLYEQAEKSMKKEIYDFETRFDFGCYEGFDLGTVYVFDPGYIKWCINNVDYFSVSNIEELQDQSVFKTELDWQYKATGTCEPYMFVYNSYRELIFNIDPGEKKYCFDTETIEKNNSKNIRKRHHVPELHKFPVDSHRSEFIAFTSFDVQILKAIKTFEINNPLCNIYDPALNGSTLIILQGTEKQYIIFLGDLKSASEFAKIPIRENDGTLLDIKCSCNNGDLNIIEVIK